MLIRMLRDQKVSEDGLTVLTYFAGKDYEANKELAQSLIDNGDAVAMIEMPERKIDDGKFQAVSDGAGRSNVRDRKRKSDK